MFGKGSMLFPWELIHAKCAFTLGRSVKDKLYIDGGHSHYQFWCEFGGFSH